MNLTFRNKKAEKICNTLKESKRHWGKVRAEKVQLRLQAVRGATTLEDLRNAPGRWEELRENRKDQISARLDGNWRIIFVPDHDPLPKLTDGGLDWSGITQLRYWEVVDYHGK